MRDLITLIEKAIQKFPGAVVYDDWSAFGARLYNALAQADGEIQFCELLGIDHHTYEDVVGRAINAWRDSTSTSLLHGTTHEDALPIAGAQIFPDIRWQTRFLMKAQNQGLKTRRIPSPEKISDPNWKPFVVVAGAWALTTSDQTALNDLLRLIYAYRRFTSSRKVKKLPKTIYRGVRAQDLWQNVEMNDIMAMIWKRDGTHQMRRKEAIDTLIAIIIKHGLNGISDGRILSFSASKAVAERFANKNGFVIQVDPNMVEIVSSELHDPERVAGVDHYTGRNEREYIVRIPDSFRWSRENFIITDTDYYVADVNPLCVGLLDHDDKEASYMMGEVPIKARWYWNSAGNGGAVKYQSGDDWWPYGRGEFKKKFGVDPLPTEKNLSQITDFKLAERKNR